MTTAILPKRSETALQIPSASALETGELAMNVTDGKFYTKTTGGVVKEVGGAGSVTLQSVVTARNAAASLQQESRSGVKITCWFTLLVGRLGSYLRV